MLPLMITAPAPKPSQDTDELPDSWFESATRIRAASSIPPRASSIPPVQTVGEFLGDELADAWLR